MKTRPHQSLFRRIGRFAADTEGLITVESLIVLPFYLYWFISTFYLFDLFRLAGINEKAAYTVADIISREQGGNDVDSDYIDGLNSIFDFLISDRGETWIRVSQIGYDLDEDDYFADWSYATKGKPALTGFVNELRDRLPVMPDGEFVILVETFTLKTGLSFQGTSGDLTTFIVTRPRFVRRIPYEGV